MVSALLSGKTSMQLTRIAILLGILASGCATGSSCTRDPITGQSRCQQASSSYAEAAGTAVAAGAAWAVVGCTVNDCEPPFRCNRDTKLCERIRCSEGRNSCPPAYSCDPVDQVCK